MNKLLDTLGAPLTTAVGIVVPYGNLDTITAYITAIVTVLCGILTIIKAGIRVYNAIKKYADGTMDIDEVCDQIDKATDDLKKEEDNNDDLQ